LKRRSDHGPAHFTLLIVPHTTQEPIALRIPHGLLYAFLLAGIALLAGLAILSINYIGAQTELAALRNEHQAELDRQRAMRETILSQGDQVRDLTSQTDRLSGDLLSMDQLVQEVRHLVGLDRVTPTPQAGGSITKTVPVATATVSRNYDGAGGMASGAAAGTENRAATSLTSRGGARSSSDAVSELQGLDATAVSQLSDLRAFRDALNARLSHVSTATWTDSASLQRQLAIYDAAPKLAPLKVPYRITSPFGMRIDPVTEWYTAMHNGIDLSAWWGTPVYATAAGKVTFSGWQGDFGYTIEIQHDMGFATKYGHNQTLIAFVGQDVKAGQLIANAGDSGRTTGPHVHYELSFNGKQIDPLTYMDASLASPTNTESIPAVP
jgi:murein DD-endopeptidase MepM/ murein hydrolase activator NlpD